MASNRPTDDAAKARPMVRSTPIALIALVLLVLGAASDVRAQTKADPAAKVGKPPVLAVVDVKKVLSSAEASKKAKKTIDARRAIYERELEQQKKDLKTRQDKLRKQRAVLATEAFNQRKKQLEQRFQAVVKQTEERRRVLNKAFNTAMANLRRELGYAVAEVMKERGIEMTLPRSAILVFDDRFDISPEVLARLNKRLPTIDLQLN